MSDKMRPTPALAPVPVSAFAEQKAKVIAERRPMLSQTPAPVRLAAAVLAAMHERAHGFISATSGDRSPRYREYQFEAKREFGIVDQAQLAYDSEDGLEIVMAGLRVLVQALGYELRQVEPSASELHDAWARSMEGTASLFAGIARAAADGRFEPHEAAGLEPVLAEAHESLTALRSAMQRAAGSQFYRRPQAVQHG